MNEKRYKWILYFITIVVISTIAIQLFWNYKNYQQNKQQVFNDIQWSLDNAVESYYTDLTKKNFLTVVNTQDKNGKIDFGSAWDSILKPLKAKAKKETKKTDLKTTFKVSSIDLSTDNPKEFDSLNQDFFQDIFYDSDTLLVSSSSKKPIRVTQLIDRDSTAITIDRKNKSVTKNKIFWGKKASDSLKLVKGLSTVFISILNDSLDYKKVDSLILNELKSKGISTDYYYSHLKKQDTLHLSKKENQPFYNLSKNAKTTYLKGDENIILQFKNPVTETFKRSLLGMLLSTLLILAVISCLFYLLKIIKHQKQLAEVKNDLISNITHEFKTPIATIGVALESIKDFDALNDTEKTKNYLNMSNDQLGKLNTMVEKLLETATLDSDNLTLNTEELNLVDFVSNLIEKQRINFGEKTVEFSHSHAIIPAKIDVFHFENALDNIIDNAIKYGGNAISIHLKKNFKTIEIAISDSGNTLTKAHKDKIFEKFYRVPKGNQHDVKGFGIGLYYTKTIIEKHEGNIALELDTKTTFKITIPNA